MKGLTSIVAVNDDGAIGVGNRLPWRLKSDLRFFKRTTLDHVIIMGRRTFDSLEGKPLPQRINIVVSHSPLRCESDLVRSAASIEEALFVAEHHSRPDADAFVIGGAAIYRQFAPYVDRYLVTVADKIVPDADTFLDAGMFGAIEGWEHRRIAEGAAGDDDECAFRIIEMTLRDQADVRARRDGAIARHRSAAGDSPRAPAVAPSSART